MLLRFFFCSLLLLALGLWACRDDNPYEPPPPTECDSWNGQGLPPVTSSGCNTFGCYVDDELFTPKGQFGTHAINASADTAFDFMGGEGTLRIIINNVDLDWTISLNSNHFHGVGKYTLHESTDGNGLGVFNDFSRPDDHRIFPGSEGELTITHYDTESWILTGTFDFKSKNELGEEVIITNGRFDLQL